MEIPSPIASTIAAEKAYSEVELQSRLLTNPDGQNGEVVTTVLSGLEQKRRETTTLLSQEELVTLKALFNIPQVKEETFYGINHVQPVLKGQFLDVKG